MLYTNIYVLYTCMHWYIHVSTSMHYYIRVICNVYVSLDKGSEARNLLPERLFAKSLRSPLCEQQPSHRTQAALSSNHMPIPNFKNRAFVSSVGHAKTMKQRFSLENRSSTSIVNFAKPTFPPFPLNPPVPPAIERHECLPRVPTPNPRHAKLRRQRGLGIQPRVG